MIKLIRREAFTLANPLGTYRWVDVEDLDAITDWTTPSPNYIERLHIIDEVVVWEKLDEKEMLRVCQGSMEARRRRKLGIT